VTLFFFQIFLTFSNNSDSVFGHNLAGGPNGILNVRPLSLFGHELPVSHEGIFNVSYLYVALAVFVVVFIALRFVNESRTGRAWRSLREDSLAAEVMGMPVNWLKLMAFAFGPRPPPHENPGDGAERRRLPRRRVPLLITLHDGDPSLGSQAVSSSARSGSVCCSNCCASPATSPVLRDRPLGLIGTLRFRASRLCSGNVARLAPTRWQQRSTEMDGGEWRTAAGGSATGQQLAVVPGDLASWVTPVSYMGLTPRC
jgi:hypothetical protein